MTNVDIQEAIQKAQAKSAKRNQVTIDSITAKHQAAFEVAQSKGQARGY